MFARGQLSLDRLCLPLGRYNLETGECDCGGEESQKESTPAAFPWVKVSSHIYVLYEHALLPYSALTVLSLSLMKGASGCSDCSELIELVDITRCEHHRAEYLAWKKAHLDTSGVLPRGIDAPSTLNTVMYDAPPGEGKLRFIFVCDVLCDALTFYVLFLSRLLLQ